MAGVATVYSTDALPLSAGAEWDYSVPIGNERPSMTRDSHDSTSIYTRPPQHNANGSRSSSVSRNVLAHDVSHSSSNRGRREQSLNRNGDVINARESIDTLARTELENDKEPSIPNELEKNSENWIHRDKLAKIESEELHRAAIQFQHRMRAESKSSAGRERSHDSYRSISNSPAATSSEYSEPWPDMRKDNGLVRPSEDRKNWDLRRPEEISAHEAAGSFYNNPALRKSSSRIPISTASPVPLAPGRRATTDEHDDETRGRTISEPYTIETDPSTPSSGSRPVSRGLPTQSTPKKTPTKATTARKASAPPPTSRKTSAAVRSRAVSGNTTQRPNTRSGETRPTTAVNRPEGDPPWLATMYKPDPRLPPDQQIIPTHAKKMQQEQWKKEDRTPTTYDRDFAPLAVRPTNDAPPPSFPKEEPIEQQTPEVEEPKIEAPPKSKTPEIQQAAPPLQRSTSTGYSTMPKVQDTPPLGLMPNPNWTPPVVTAQEKPKDDKEDKGCGCCIVM
ncbi:hypothetical protein N7495_006280 [Penicillium taxi]|uniref:uncharacterized protein n=1 Tax=Penicillium taxi TaxID=168475 RepID=UPI002545319B|nr:uncharacterized protein N7495_006280 [Penicillium taxi]KAJ5894589.1 hypothetical protein N7495_006280 [Penicillium taxi]